LILQPLLACTSAPCKSVCRLLRLSLAFFGHTAPYLRVLCVFGVLIELP